jgi:signal transduction histidine kinase
MNIRRSYINTIKRNCASPPNAIKDVSYWRNNLFAGIIIFLLPLCIIALIPGVYWSFFTHQYIIAQADIAVVISILVIAFIPGIALHIRKILFVISAYILSCIMLYTLGLTGPGQLYLLIACTFSILIFPTKYSLWPAIANTFICVLVAIGVYYKKLPWPDNNENSLGAWIAVSSNLVFLSFLISVLIPKLFNGLQVTLDNEKNLAHKLSIEQESLTNAMEMLEKKNIQLEQFSYAASHDLQEPLRMVTGFLSQLENKYENFIDAKGKQYISFAVNGAKRMQQIILDLLEFSHTGNQRESIEDINLNELINEIIILYYTQIEKQNAKIIVEELPIIHSNKIALNQVFQNLISNSLKYCHAEGEVIIKIGAIEKEMHWQFSINDNGIGISKEDFEKVFIIFQRLHNKEKYPGTGIGLAITKKNIEQMGGEIWLESEENKGSTFYFTIIK